MISIDKLKYLMLMECISSKDLSERTQIERSTLQKILNGSTTNPRIETVYTLAEYFKVDISELLITSNALSSSKNASTPPIKDNLAKLMHLNGINSISLLTRYTGISTSILSEILSGNTKKPQINTLEQIANFFCITVPQLTGIDKLPNLKTISITPANRVIPIISLEQSYAWISGDIKSSLEYYNASREMAGSKAYAINIANNSFSPDFIENHTLIVDNGESIKEKDFIVCKITEKTSIYECLELDDDLMTYREAGSQKKHQTELSQIEVLGVVVEQVLSRRMN